MSNNLSFFTDNELTQAVWLSPHPTPMELELVERLQRALDEIEDLDG